MFVRMTLVCLLLFLWRYSKAQSDYFWLPVEAEGIEITGIVGYDSSGDLWLIHKNNTLYRLSDQSLSGPYDLPEDTSDRVIIFLSQDDTFFISSINSDYKTQFFMGHPLKGWEKAGGIHENAMRYWAETKEGRVFVAGDWGSLVEVDRGRSELIKLRLPYSDHITEMVAIENTLYLGLRNVGLVMFSEDSSFIVPGSSQISSDISAIDALKGNGLPSFITFNGQYYAWADSSYVLVSVAPLDNGSGFGSFDRDHLPSIYGVSGNIYRFDGAEWNRQKLPSGNRTLSFTEDIEKQPILMDEDGQLYRKTRTGRLYFTQSTESTELSGNAMHTSSSIRSTDINDDGRLDIIITDNSSTNSVHLYIQQEDGNYRDETALYFQTDPGQITKLLVIDLSDDGVQDLVTLTHSGDVLTIRSYVQFDQNFVPRFEQSIPSSELQDLRAMTTGDVDSDGDLDVILGFYYSQGRNKGIVALLKNDGRGELSLHLSNDNLYRFWVSSLWFGDLNNDRKMELIIGNYWDSDVVIQDPFSEGNEKVSELPDSMNTTHILTADIDRSGTFEIIRNSQESGVEVIEWQGEGQYRVSAQNYKNRDSVITSYILTDFNSDGWVDILITGEFKSSPFDHIWLNNEGVLRQTHQSVGLDDATGGQMFPFDFDRDGDSDLIVLKEGLNQLFENHINPDNYVRVSNREGASISKQWLVRSSSADFLMHQVQVTGLGNTSAEWLFGKKKGEEIAIFNEDKAFKKNIESNGRSEGEIFTPQLLFGHRIRHFVNYYWQVLFIRDFYFYLVTLILASTILMLTYYTGGHFLNWEWKSLIIVTLANSSVFWILIVLAKNLTGFWQYGIPVGGVIGGSVIPVFFSIQNQLFNTTRSKKDSQGQLLELMLKFSHGAWSYSVINRLHLLLANPPEQPYSEKYKDQLKERRISFLNIVLPELKQTSELLKRSGYAEELFKPLSDSVSFFDDNLNQSKTDSDTNRRLIRELESLSKNIRKIRNAVWADHSCDLIEVIQQVTDLYRDEFAKLGIELIRETDGSTCAWVLTPAGSMAEIIDNLIVNAIHALNGNTHKSISFYIYHKAPKWVLEVADTGQGIDADDMELVFESGYSGRGSTGSGLYHTKETMSRYGARIFIKESEIGKGTCFQLECIEGVSR